MPLFGIGQCVEKTLRPCLRGQDAFDGVERMGAKADGPFQGGEPIRVRVRRQQCQHFDRLTLALTLIAHQASEEALRHRSEFGKALAQQDLVLAGIGTGPMRLLFGTLPGRATWPESMASDFVNLGTVDD